MNTKIELSIIYIYYNTPNELFSSLESLKTQLSEIEYEIFIVNNASPRDIPFLKTEFKNLHVISNKKNIGYGAAINQAAKQSMGKYLLVLNSDVIFKNNLVKLLLDKISADSTIGIIGPQILNKNEEIIPTSSEVITPLKAMIVFTFLGNVFPLTMIKNRYFLSSFARKQMVDVPNVSGACMLFSKEAFQKAEGFDERFFLYFEEIDICYRIKEAGYKIIYLPDAKIIHTFGTSSKSSNNIRKSFERSRYRLLSKYHTRFFSLFSEIFIRVFTISPYTLRSEAY